jgi:hypothetical protein
LLRSSAGKTRYVKGECEKSRPLTMLVRTLLGSAGCLAIALSISYAAPAPGLKIIHVHQVLSRRALPATPASEDAAASLRWLPRVIRLRPAEKSFDPYNMLPDARLLTDPFRYLPQ